VAPSADLTLALELADLADAVAARWFRAERLRVDSKDDATPVTEADRGAERVIRERLGRVRPDDAVAGEEYGSSGPARRRWIIDPIDGTLNFVRGVPVWATLVALEEDGVVVAGVVSAPAIGHRWWASQGGGAYRNAEPIRVSTVARIEEAHLSYNSMATAEDHGIGPQMSSLERRCARTRGFGDFWSFMLLAEGGVDIAVEPVAALWDLAALQVIVEEAGGRFTDFAGAPTPDGGNAVGTNGILHDAVLEILGPGSQSSE
jgi:histidinol-phosphatase